MDIEAHGEKEISTRKEIAKIILKRYHFTAYSFVALFLLTLVSNIILSIFVDNENFYRYGPNKNIHWGIAISDSMTGNISKPVAVVLIFLSAIYLLSLIQFQFIFLKILIGENLKKNEITLEVAQKIWVYNKLANSIANFAIIFLILLANFDAWKFHMLHNFAAAMFFILTVVYQILRRKIEGIVIDQKLLEMEEKKNGWILYACIISLVIFLTSVSYLHFGVTRKEKFQDSSLPWIIAIFMFEYLLCIFSVINFAVEPFVQENIFKQYDFKQLLHLKMFCLFSIVQNLSCVNKDIPAEIL